MLCEKLIIDMKKFLPLGAFSGITESDIRGATGILKIFLFINTTVSAKSNNSEHITLYFFAL